MVLDAALPPTIALCRRWDVQAGISRPRAFGPITRTTVLATDIIGFGSSYRDAGSQLLIRHMHYELLINAFESTGLPWWDCHREDRGDGALIVAPPSIDPDRFLDPFIRHLDAMLRQCAGTADELSQLRLRLAVHHGYVYYDAHGVAGHALIHLFRLLEAPAFKKALASSRARLGAIVSDQLYTEAAQRRDLTDPAAYRPLRLTHKETRTRAWLWSAE